MPPGSGPLHAGTAAAARGGLAAARDDLAADGPAASGEGGPGGPSEDDAAAVVPSISQRAAVGNTTDQADGFADHNHDRPLDASAAEDEVALPRKRQHT